MNHQNVSVLGHARGERGHTFVEDPARERVRPTPKPSKKLNNGGRRAAEVNRISGFGRPDDDVAKARGTACHREYQETCQITVPWQDLGLWVRKSVAFLDQSRGGCQDERSRKTLQT